MVSFTITWLLPLASILEDSLKSALAITIDFETHHKDNDIKSYIQIFRSHLGHNNKILGHTIEFNKIHKSFYLSAFSSIQFHAVLLFVCLSGARMQNPNELAYQLFGFLRS